MKTRNFESFAFIFLSTLILVTTRCQAVIDLDRGTECSEADNSTAGSSFKTNLNKLLTSLSSNAPLNDGFYKTRAGKGSSKVYGLVQCRGDISASNCGNCTRESIRTALQGCPKSKNVAIWKTWCSVQYYVKDFSGDVGLTSVATYNDTDVESPSMNGNGLQFMNEIAALAPKKRLMFNFGVLDAGRNGKRYGMAQCSRDISTSDCVKCLDGQLQSFGPTVGNLRGWESFGSGCRMWYHDFKFYFNVTIPANTGGRRDPSANGVETGIGIVISTLALLVI